MNFENSVEDYFIISAFHFGGRGGRKNQKVVHIVDCHHSHDCHEDDSHHISFGGHDYHDDHSDYHGDYHDYGHGHYDYSHGHDYHNDYHDYHGDDHDYHGYGSRSKYTVEKPKIVIIKKIIDVSTTTVPTGK